jgi:hypothetical protein
MNNGCGEHARERGEAQPPCGYHLLSVMALAWLFLTAMADIENMSAVMAIAMQGPPWGATGFALMFLM